MRGVRAAIVCLLTALAVSGCVHTNSPVATAQPRSDLDTMAYGQPAYYPAPVASAAPPANSSGAFAALNASLSASRRTYAQPQPAQYAPPQAAYAAAPMPVAYDAAYRLDAGDKLRVVVYGQEGLTNTYAIDAGGSITMPLIGSVPARGRTPAGLAAEIAGKLRSGYIRDPSVAVEIEAYRPFFILGEVAAPGQYPYVPNMSVESAVAIAGGFSPRAKRHSVMISRNADRVIVPLGTPIGPGDTVLVGERWF